MLFLFSQVCFDEILFLLLFLIEEHPQNKIFFFYRNSQGEDCFYFHVTGDRTLCHTTPHCVYPHRVYATQSMIMVFLAILSYIQIYQNPSRMIRAGHLQTFL